MNVFLWFFIVWWLVSFLPPFIIHIPVPFRVVAFTAAPFIVHNTYYQMESWTISHEKRHLLQQRIFSPFGMLIAYFAISGIIYIYSLIKHKNFYKAYYDSYMLNPFEIDARKHGGWYT